MSNLDLDPMYMEAPREWSLTKKEYKSRRPSMGGDSDPQTPRGYATVSKHTLKK